MACLRKAEVNSSRGVGRQCHAKNLYSGHDFCGPAPVSFSPFSSSGLLPFLGVFFSLSRLSLILPLPMCPCCSSSQDTNGYLESSSIPITHFFFFCKIFPLLCVYGCFAYMCVCTTCIQCLRSQKRETYPLGMQLKMVVSQPWELEIKLGPLQEPPVLLTTQLLCSFSLLFYSFLSPERRGLLVMSFRTKHSKDSHSRNNVGLCTYSHPLQEEGSLIIEQTHFLIISSSHHRGETLTLTPTLTPTPTLSPEQCR